MSTAAQSAAPALPWAARAVQTMVEALAQPVDAASMAAFRVLFGLMNLYGTLRFIAYSWVDRFYVQPDFYFTFWGFEWVQVLPPAAMHAAFWTLAGLSLCIAVGFLYRFAIITFFALFTYVELIDVSNYLNHYYLVSLLAFVMCWLPLNRMGSVDAWLRPALRSETLPQLVPAVLRFQVGVVYFFAGLAKFGTDWLVHAQPLNLWLGARTETPIIGPWLDEWWVAFVMSWGGFLFDTTIWIWLLWPLTRPWAYALVVVFHVLTGQLFLIGMFPIIMMTSATVFFSPAWPRRWFARGTAPEIPPAPVRATALHRLAVFAWALWMVVMVAMPLRTHIYGGNVLWHEQGMRWSWRVMVREKNGAVTYRVELPSEQRRQYVSPSRYLTDQQEREMSGQPDLILQLAHHIADDYRARGHADVEVYVEALVSLNGRPPQLLIDPEANLAAIADGLAPADWILPAPTDPPPHLRALR